MRTPKRGTRRVSTLAHRDEEGALTRLRRCAPSFGNGFALMRDDETHPIHEGSPHEEPLFVSPAFDSGLEGLGSREDDLLWD